MNLLASVFKNRNYKLYYIGQCVSLTGLWMQRVALNWLVYGLTGSSFLLGVFDFTMQIPVLVFSGITGAIMEGRDIRKLMIFCQSLCLLHALTLTILTLSGTIRYEYILLLALLVGTSDSFELPARQSIVPALIEDPRDLGSGIALISMLFNMTRLIGPSIAGLIIAIAGEGMCFLVNTFAYIPTLAVLFMIRLTRPTSPQISNRGVAKNFRDGINYVKNFLPIRNSLISMALISFFAFPYLTLTTVFARDILGGKPYTLGFLMAATGCGALLGAFRLSCKKSPAGLMKEMGFAAVAFGFFLIIFSLSENFFISLLLISCIGFCSVTSIISCSTINQTLVDEDKRSRVMSLHVMATIGATSIGSLCAGGIASFMGAPLTLASFGTVALLVGLWLLKINPKMNALARPVFESKGF
jgi:MFS family permease